ncbi:hypothetical protein TKK_0013365 [Trichogramma kaykai]
MFQDGSRTSTTKAGRDGRAVDDAMREKPKLDSNAALQRHGKEYPDVCRIFHRKEERQCNSRGNLQANGKPTAKRSSRPDGKPKEDDQLEENLAGTFEKFHRFEAEWGEEAVRYSGAHRCNVKDWEDECKAIGEWRAEREEKRRRQDEMAERKKAELKIKLKRMEEIRKERDEREAELARLQKEAQDAQEILNRVESTDVLDSMRACFHCEFPGVRSPWNCPRKYTHHKK